MTSFIHHLCIVLVAAAALSVGAAQDLPGHSHDSHHHRVPSLRDAVLAKFEQVGVPLPYHFQYAVDAADGGHSREESSDAAGRVTGSYTIRLADGRARTVTYTADEGGYRASITTNEMGTESQSPADVTLNSSAPTGKDAAALAHSAIGHAPVNQGHVNHHHERSVPARFSLGRF